MPNVDVVAALYMIVRAQEEPPVRFRVISCQYDVISFLNRGVIDE
jgi:hypothetical protein